MRSADDDDEYIKFTAANTAVSSNNTAFAKYHLISQQGEQGIALQPFAVPRWPFSGQLASSANNLRFAWADDRNDELPENARTSRTFSAAEKPECTPLVAALSGATE